MKLISYLMQLPFAELSITWITTHFREKAYLEQRTTSLLHPCPLNPFIFYSGFFPTIITIDFIYKYLSPICSS